MAEFVNFPESNKIWRGWKAEPDDPTEVGDLPVHTTAKNEQISCWRLSWRERLSALCHGKVWLYVMGRQPPVYVTSKKTVFQTKGQPHT